MQICIRKVRKKVLFHTSDKLLHQQNIHARNREKKILKREEKRRRNWNILQFIQPELHIHTNFFFIEPINTNGIVS